MNYLSAMHRYDGRWDFTINGHPTGYCTDFPPTENKYNILGWEEHLAKCEVNRHKYHTDGHATKEEACACFLEYELDNRWREWESSSQQQKCRECGCWTTHIIQLGSYAMYSLCIEHATKDIVRKLHGPIGEIWQS